MSRDAAAALMCRLGCRTELLQSRARAKVPTELAERSTEPAGRLAQPHPTHIHAVHYGIRMNTSTPGQAIDTLG